MLMGKSHVSHEQVRIATMLPTDYLLPTTYYLLPATYLPTDRPTDRPTDLPTYLPACLPTYHYYYYLLLAHTLIWSWDAGMCKYCMQWLDSFGLPLGMQATHKQKSPVQGFWHNNLSCGK